MRILITGGAGYIGSHTLLDLLSADHEVLVVDNFSNSSPKALDRVRELTNRTFELVQADIRDLSSLDNVITKFKPEAVIHFAGLKAVGESTEFPLKYYDHNVNGTLSLLRAMDAVGCRNIVFSSSSTVYGDPEYLPYDENHRRLPASPYGRTKYFAEDILSDWAATGDKSAVFLRYFNPVGAHDSGRIGEDPWGIPNNLMPFVSQVAVGRHPKLKVFGNDYDTPDGTCIRDYIHVSDLATAHVAAVKYAADNRGADAMNIGTGTGSSVLDVVAAFEKATARKIPYDIAPRRAGDIGAYYANAEKAKRLLGWQAKYSLEDMCASAWKWQSMNPNGYND